MDALFKEAVELTKIQATVRSMSGEEMEKMLNGLAVGLRGIVEGKKEVSELVEVDWRKSIKARSITCLECGQSFKVLTKKHLAKHDLEPFEYRAIHGMPKGTPLIAKELSKARRERMKGIQLWKRKKGTGSTLPETSVS